MTRIVKERDERYNEFLDTAQRLFYQRGYEQTPIQAIIDAMNVAKGTFYHYFASKAELLDALVERMVTHNLLTFEAIIADQSLHAVQKFEQFFAYNGSWKAANRDFLLDVLHAMYCDENIVLRTRMQTRMAARVTPLLANIVRQGVAEGHFDSPYPDEAAEIVLRMGQMLAESVVQRLLAGESTASSATLAHDIEHKVHAYNRSVERVLGAPAESLRLVNMRDIQIWFPKE